MGFLELIGWLVVLGVFLWVLEFLLKEYIKPWMLALIEKLVIVLVVLILLNFVLHLIGMGPRLHLYPLVP